MSKKVAVIDGNSLMHRAYHAIQTPMSAPDGTPTNAVFGFMQMLCKFVETAHPDALVCAFDAGKPEFRMQELPSYKAQRPHMDDELRCQFPVVEKLLEAMRIPVVKVPGWEGDDILGTVAARDEALGYRTLLVTGDKDACQLATELTQIVTTKKGITDVAIRGPDEVMEKYGVSPAQFTDFLGLMGDKSDNIPGVTGVGPKSATTLLEKYGTIEGIYEHIDELRGKQRQRLEEERELAFLSRQIATIVTDLDFPLDLESISFPAFDASEVESAFKSYSLMSPLARVLSLVGGHATAEMVEIDPGPLCEGTAAKEMLEGAGYEVVECLILPDEPAALKTQLKRLADGRQVDLVVTSGGTGFSMRDQTPEATMAVADRNAPGIAEYIRYRSMEKTSRAMLSRGVSVIRGKTLIVNLPGSPKAVRESLEFILEPVEHGLEILRGTALECGRK